MRLDSDERSACGVELHHLKYCKDFGGICVARQALSLLVGQSVVAKMHLLCSRDIRLTFLARNVLIPHSTHDASMGVLQAGKCGSFRGTDVLGRTGHAIVIELVQKEVHCLS